jgi:ribosome-binding factor A
MRRIEQVNELLKEKLATLISQEVPMENGLITISYVDCSPDLRNVKIGISVLPFDLSDSALKRLNKQSSNFTNILKKETRLRKIPKFKWEIDNTEEKAGEIEKILEEIKLENSK